MMTPGGTNNDKEYRYNRLTWPEMNDAIARQPVVILPTGSTEQHGRHLPIDVALLLAESVCLEAGRRGEGRAPAAAGAGSSSPARCSTGNASPPRRS